eukprot:c49441_g1_i1 orf=35-226(+)
MEDAVPASALCNLEEQQLIVDESGLHLIHPETYNESWEIIQTCAAFRLKLSHFQEVSKQMLDQ